MSSWLIRHGEIFLKGKNKHMFEKRLVNNIKDCLKKNNVEFSSAELMHNRIIVFSDNNCSCLKRVFGISSFSKAIETAQDIGEIKKATLSLYKKGSFRITSQRLEKDFKYNSNQINKLIGAYVVKKTNAKVSLENPDINIGIELFNKKAYIFNNKIICFGGLPVGIEGNVAVLLEDKNSVLAGILMLKRGCSVVLVERNKVKYDLLKKFCYGFNLEVNKKIPKNVKAVVVNDTIDGVKKRNFKLTVFRPLIGYDVRELQKWLK